MAEFKARKYVIAVADAAAGLSVTPGSLGFNPSHEFSKVQIATNDFGGGAGSFSIELSPPNNPGFYPLALLAAPIGGQDIVIIDPYTNDPLWDSLNIAFDGVTDDIEVYLTFIKK